MLGTFFTLCFFWMTLFNMEKTIGVEPRLLSELSNEHLHTVSQEDLHLDDKNILVNINGTLYPVSSLKRIGNQWLVSLESQHNPRYQCPWGHSLCGYCHMCHKTICPEYIPRCSASK